MSKYLLIQSTFDERIFYSFESDKDVETLNKELPKKLSREDDSYLFSFYGFELDSCWRHTFEVVSLEDFWNSNTVENHWLTKFRDKCLETG